MRNNIGYGKVILSGIAHKVKVSRDNVVYSTRCSAKATLADTEDGCRMVFVIRKRIDERAKDLRELCNRVLVQQLHCWTLWQASLKHLYDIARDESEYDRVSRELKFTEADSSKAFESVCYALTGDCSDQLWDGWLKYQAQR